MKIKLMAIIGVSVTMCVSTFASAQASLKPNQETAIYTGSSKMNTVNIIDKNIQRTYALASGQTITSGKIGVEGAGQRVTPTQTREVWVRLRNLTDYPQNILVRTTWYDRDEFPVEEASAWDRLSFGQNAGEVYRSKSIRTDAVFFSVEIQEVR